MSSPKLREYLDVQTWEVGEMVDREGGIGKHRDAPSPQVAPADLTPLLLAQEPTQDPKAQHRRESKGGVREPQ